MLQKRFPAHDELGTCRTSLVSPEQPEHLTEHLDFNNKGQELKDAQKACETAGKGKAAAGVVEQTDQDRCS